MPVEKPPSGSAASESMVPVKKSSSTAGVGEEAAASIYSHRAHPPPTPLRSTCPATSIGAIAEHGAMSPSHYHGARRHEASPAVAMSTGAVVEHEAVAHEP